jgi:hypothetical protein
MAYTAKVRTKVQHAIILEECQNLIENTIRITIAHFSETTLTASPCELLKNDALVQKMNKIDLFRLSFLGGIEHEEALAKRINRSSVNMIIKQ